MALRHALFWGDARQGVWWTAGGAAITLDDHDLAYQPLHTFSPKRIPLAEVIACAPRPGTEALRLVHFGKKGEQREFFLNLAVIRGRNEFLDQLGRALEARGLRPIANERNSWRRPEWEGW